MNKHNETTPARARENGLRGGFWNGRMIALIACGLTVAASSLYAEKGGSKGKPGGGGEDPSPPPVEAAFTAELVPRPSWADSYDARQINNNGDVVGHTMVKLSRRVTRYRDGFIWRDGIVSALAPLPGHDEGRPIDLSDDGSIIVGISQPEGSGYEDDTLVAWVDAGGGNFAVVNLEDILNDAAPVHLPQWNIVDFYESLGGLTLKTAPTVLTSDGQFMLIGVALAADSWGPGTVPPWGNEEFFTEAVVQWDWSDPFNPVVANIWVLAQSADVDQNGYLVGGLGMERGISGSPDQTDELRVVGEMLIFGPDGELVSGPSPAFMWELDLSDAEIRDPILTTLAVPSPEPSWMGASGVNSLGEVIGTASASASETYFWDVNGNPEKIELLPDATYAIPNAINSAGTVVGRRSGDHPFLWTVQSGTMVDLNTLVGGNLGLRYARSINESGQILGGQSQSDGWYLLTPIPVP